MPIDDLLPALYATHPRCDVAKITAKLLLERSRPHCHAAPSAAQCPASPAPAPPADSANSTGVLRALALRDDLVHQLVSVSQLSGPQCERSSNEDNEEVIIGRGANGADDQDVVLTAPAWWLPHSLATP
jgi:hypothetical protein